MRKGAVIDYEAAFEDVETDAYEEITQLSSLTNVQLAVLAIRKRAQLKKFINLVQVGDIEIYPEVDVYADTQMLLKEQEKRLNDLNFKYSPYQYVKSTSVEVSVGPRQLVTLSKEGKVVDYKIDRGFVQAGEDADQMLLRAVTVVLSTTAMEVTTTTTDKGQMKTTKIAPADFRGDLLPPIPDTRILKAIDFAPCFQGQTTMLDVREQVLDYLSTTDKKKTATLLYFAHYMNIIKNPNKYKNANCAKMIGENIPARLRELEDKIKVSKIKDEIVQLSETVKRVQQEESIARHMVENKLKPVIYNSPAVLTYPIVTGIISMWKTIKGHRDVRGENSKRISPFTNGMYYCDVAGDYRGLTSAAALLSSMKVMNCQAIMRIDLGYFKSAWNVLELNTVVHRTGVYAAHTGQEYGTYSLKNATDKYRILKVYFVGHTQPTVTSTPKEAVQFSPAEQDAIAIIQSIFKQATPNMPILVVTYGFPELWNTFEGQIGAHAHAHAGVVNVYSVPIKTKFTYKDFLARTIAATVQKTYFPFTGKSWIAQDRFMQWPTVRVVRSKLKNVNIFSTLQYQDVHEGKPGEEVVLTLPEAKFDEYEQQAVLVAAEADVQQERLASRPAPVPDVKLQEEPATLPPSTMTNEQLIHMINGMEAIVDEWGDA